MSSTCRPRSLPGYIPTGLDRTCTQAHPNNVIARNGKAWNGSGSDSGVNPAPPKIRTAVTANSTDATVPVTRTKIGTAGDALIRAKAAAHNPAPAPNDGAAAASANAEPETISVSPHSAALLASFMKPEPSGPQESRAPKVFT